MGGNSRAIDRSTGEVIVVTGRSAFAERVNLFDVDTVVSFREAVKTTLLALGSKFQTIKGFPLWPAKTSFAMGHCFMGSAAHVLCPNSPGEKELIRNMPTIGDIDVAVPEGFLADLWAVLCECESHHIGPMRYLGQNRQKLRRPSINAVFQWKDNFVQIDFVGTTVSADTGDVEPFVRFAHSSSWEDRVKGVKGVAHKYLLQTLAWAVSYDPQVIILTDKSPLYPPDKVRVKTLHEPPRPMSFSVDRGIRMRLEQQFEPNGKPLVVLGKNAYKEVPTSQSQYVTDLNSIFMLLFGRSPEEGDMEEFASFHGLIRLGKKYLDDATLNRALDFMIRYKLYGVGQALSRDSAAEDKKVKARICEVICDMTFIKTDPKLVAEYYKNYKEREVSE